MIRTSRPNWKLVVVLIAVMGIMALTSLGSAPPVRAQGGYDWSINYDFTTGDGGFTDLYSGYWATGGPSLYVSGTGWRYGDGEIPAANYYRIVGIIKNFGTTVNVQHVKVTFTLVDGGNTCSTCITNYIAFDVDQVSNPYSSAIFGTHVTHEWTGVEFTNTLKVSEDASYCSGIPNDCGGATPIYQGNAVIESVLIEGGGTPPETSTPTPSPTPTVTPTATPPPPSNWAYPFAVNDRTVTPAEGQVKPPFMEIDAPDIGSVGPQSGAFIAYGRAGANVHSMIGGTVAAVFPLRGDCQPLDLTGTGYGQINTGIPLGRPGPGFPKPASTCFNQLTDHGSSLTESDILRKEYLDYSSAQVVRVTVPDFGTLTYILADVKVGVGQSISKGCILGKALSLYPETKAIGDLAVSTSEGYMLALGKNNIGDPQDISALTTDEPQDIICGASNGNGTACKLVHNYTFDNNAEGWTLSADNTGNTPKNPPGLTTGLIPTGAAHQTLNLDPTHQYIITIISHLVSPLPPSPGNPKQNFWVNLGNTIQEVRIGDPTIASPQTNIIPAATYTANSSDGLGNYFDLYLAGYDLTNPAILSQAQPGNLIVDSLCVSDSTDAPPAPAGGCLLYDPEFDAAVQPGGSGIWAMNEVVGAEGMPWIENGLAMLPKGALIVQSLTLSPKDSGPQDYVITVKARRRGASSSGQYMQVNWSWGGSFGGLITDPQFSDHTFRNATASLTVTSSATNDLVIGATSTGGTGQILEVDSVCVTTADGANPPGYAAGSGMILTAQCKTCTYAPVGDLTVDVPELISWLFCAISQIWYCQAKTILYGIWTATVNILTFLGFWRLWMSATMTAGVQWANADWLVFTTWLNGSFANLISAVHSPQVISSGANFFDFLIALVNGLRDVLNNFLNSIMTLISGIIQLVVAVINLILGLIWQILSYILGLLPAIITAIFTAFNTAATTPPPGAPTCSNPSALLYWPCLGFYVLDNTILSGPISWFLPIVEAIAAFNALLWAFYKLRQAVTE